MATASLSKGAVLSITNLDAALGAEIRGIDLSKPLAPDEVDALEGAWRERLVLVFHDQRLSDPQLLAVSSHFGEIDASGLSRPTRFRSP